MLSEAGKPLRREHWTIHLALRIGFPQHINEPTRFLQQAWQSLQHQHPALGATVDDSSAIPRLVAGAIDTNTWVSETFAVCYEYKTAQDLFPNLHSTPTATCYWLPASSEIVIRSSHWRIDGVGMVLLAHDFMTALASAVQHDGHDAPLKVLMPDSNDPRPLGPSLEQLASAQSKFPATRDGTEHPLLAAAADALVGQFLRGVPSIGLPTRAGSAESVPGASGCGAVRLDAAKTMKVTTACRRDGIKVTSAVHAAIVRVAAGFPQHPLSKSYAAFVPVDLRRALDATATPETKAASKVVGLYFSGLPVCVDSVIPQDGASAKSFKDIARDLAAVYGRDLVQFWAPDDESDQKLGLLDIAEPYLRRTTALFGAPVPEGFPPTQTPDLSSLGRVEAYLQHDYGSANGNVQLKDVWLGTEMLNRCVQFHTWSWRGELTIGACFNLSFYEKGLVDDILNKVVQELLEGCGVEN
ncbi:hypothetical protein Hte_010643 [Hypoxylon texense]